LLLHKKNGITSFTCAVFAAVLSLLVRPFKEEANGKVAPGPLCPTGNTKPALPVLY
jgi:hypothetical protein